MFRRTLGEIALTTSGHVARGASGVPVAGVSIDSRSIAGGELFVALHGEANDGHDYLGAATEGGASVVLIEKGRDLPAGDFGVVEVSDTRKALLALSAEYRGHLPARVVAVTGSAGKSTTKEIVAHLLEKRGAVSKAPKSFNNIIGLSMTLFASGPKDDFLVCEIGTSAPGEIGELSSAARPDAAVVTNIGPAHLERLGTLEGVAREKAAILDHLADGGVAVLPADSDFIDLLRARAGQAAVVECGFSGAAQVRAEDVRLDGYGTSFRLNGAADVRLPLVGRHNVANAIAAAAVAWRFGMEIGEIAEQLGTATGLPQRGRLIRLQDIIVMDDSYNANPASFRAALSTLEEVGTGSLVVVAGDMLELGAGSAALHEGLGVEIAGISPRLFVAVGDHIAASADAAESAGLDAVERFAAADDAAGRVCDLVRPGDAVLVKASRRIGLEAVVSALVERFSANE